MAERSRHAGSRQRPRRKRDPEATREAILEAAREMMARDGKDSLSVAQVSLRAGVNRGTAYQHFQTREQLIDATAAWVGEKMYFAVFGDTALVRDRAGRPTSVEALTNHLANFAMENPEMGRLWLLELLNSRRPASDPFWRRYKSNFELFARSDSAQPGIDAEVASVLTLAGCFLWPVWARAHTRNGKERQQMAVRFAREVIRMSLHGTMRPEKYPELDLKPRPVPPSRHDARSRKAGTTSSSARRR